MGRRERLADALSEWARDEMQASTVPDPMRLAMLCKGNGEHLMRFLVENVRSSDYVRHVRDNLRVYGKPATDQMQTRSKQAELAKLRSLTQAIARADMHSVALSNEIESLREELSSSEQRDQPLGSSIGGALTHIAHVHVETAALENLVSLREKLVPHTKQVSKILRPETPAESLKMTGEAADGETPQGRPNLPSFADETSETTDEGTPRPGDSELGGCESDWSREYHIFRSRVVDKAQRQHIQMATAVHQTASERQTAEKKLSAAIAVGPEGCDVPASVLKAFIAGEQAAATSISEQGDQLALRIHELRDHIENSVGVLARVEQMERALEQGAVEAHGYLSKFDNLHTTLHARSEELRALCRSLTESLSALVTNLRDLQTSVHNMIQASRAVGNTGSTCGMPHHGPLGGIHPVARATKLLIDRETLSAASEMIVHAHDQLSRDIRSERTVEKGLEALASLTERSEGMSSAGAHAVSEISQMVNDTIPRLTRECSDALAIWWDQPARGSGFWKEADAQAA